jgi:hypothetical protein
MSTMIYEASVYSREVSYRDYKGQDHTMTLYFALDPLQLLQAFATVETKKIKSGNPALNGKVEALSEDVQLKLVRDLAIMSAGAPSDDGQYWESFPNFDESIVGKAFLTQLTASDGDRREFAEKVMLDPLRAFVAFAEADESNSPADVQMFRTQLNQVENIFKSSGKKDETLDERKARLAAELASLDSGPANGVSDGS